MDAKGIFIIGLLIFLIFSFGCATKHGLKIIEHLFINNDSSSASKITSQFQKKAIETFCIDTDGGIDYYEKGRITVIYSDGRKRTEVDSCNPDGTLREWYCGRSGDPAGLLRSENYVVCKYGCKDGACIEKPSVLVKCEKGFIKNEGYCQPRILNIGWDANLKKALEDSIWVRADENGEVKNFLSNQDFRADVDRAIGPETDQEKIAKNIANWIKRLKPYGCNISDLNDPCYGHSPVNNITTNLTDFDYIYNYPEGVCFDAAVLTVAALRVANIPAIIHLEKTSSFHANTLAYINGEWVKIDSTFCSRESINEGRCPNASFIKKPAYGVYEIWAPVGNNVYCRRDGFCMEAPGIPTSGEILLSSSSLQSVTVTYPRFSQITKLPDSGASIYCEGAGWSINDAKAIQLINQSRINEVKDAYVTYLVTGNASKYDKLGIRYLSKKADFTTFLYNDLTPIGYFRANIPKNLLFLYMCHSQNGTILAYKDVLAENSIITADDLIKTSGLSDEDFNYLKQKIKESTEGLGISPTEKAVG